MKISLIIFYCTDNGGIGISSRHMYNTCMTRLEKPFLLSVGIDSTWASNHQASSANCLIDWLNLLYNMMLKYGQTM